MDTSVSKSDRGNFSSKVPPPPPGAFLAVSSKQILGNKALAVTANSPSLAPSELTKAVELAQEFNINHKIIETNEVEREDYKANDANRCYFCKDELYTHLSVFASKA